MAKRDKRKSRPQISTHAKKLKKSGKKGGAEATQDYPKVTINTLAQAMNHAVTLHNQGQLARAKRIYQQVIRLTPDHPDALSSLAMIEYQARHFDEATILLGKAIAIVPDNAGYYMNLGALLDAMGKTQEAETAYRQSIKLNKTYADPYYNLGDLYLRTRRPAEAIKVFDECMAALDRDYHALAYKAHALADAEQFEAANDLLDFDQYLKRYRFEPPRGFETINEFNQALADHIKRHPTLQANVMSTMHGKHTAELLQEPSGPMRAMERHIHEAVRWYIDQLPEDQHHPVVRFKPTVWKLTTWGVIMTDKGHERPHIHPKGWLSGVFYLDLPDIITNADRQPEGWLEFGRPSAELHVQSEPRLRHYQPEYGQMFLFPSYFYHGTVPFRSRQRRICVAFDIEPRG